MKLAQSGCKLALSLNLWVYLYFSFCLLLLLSFYVKYLSFCLYSFLKKYFFTLYFFLCIIFFSLVVSFFISFSLIWPKFKKSFSTSNSSPARHDDVTQTSVSRCLITARARKLIRLDSKNIASQAVKRPRLLLLYSNCTLVTADPLF